MGKFLVPSTQLSEEKIVGDDLLGIIYINGTFAKRIDFGHENLLETNTQIFKMCNISLIGMHLNSHYCQNHEKTNHFLYTNNFA